MGQAFESLRNHISSARGTISVVSRVYFFGVGMGAAPPVPVARLGAMSQTGGGLYEIFGLIYANFGALGACGQPADVRFYSICRRCLWQSATYTIIIYMAVAAACFGIRCGLSCGAGCRRCHWPCGISALDRPPGITLGQARNARHLLLNIIVLTIIKLNGGGVKLITVVILYPNDTKVCHGVTLYFG